MRGQAKYEQELIEVLQGTDSISSEELVRRLDEDRPDPELMEGIDNQLQQLESYWQINHIAHGWQWVR